MRYGALFFLAALCLLLGGCSQLPKQAVGPQGGGEPLPLNDQEQTPRAIAPQRPMRRQRRNAALGRPVMPDENAACNACGGGSGCDYPVWLYEAQKQDGLYIGCIASAAAPNGNGSAMPLVFSHFSGGGAAPNGFLPPQGQKFLPMQAGQSAPAAFPGRKPCWGGLFADWCLTQSCSPKTGRPYAGLGKGVAVAENWLHYGAASEACFGALMVAAQKDTYSLAFCIGALSVPVNGAAGRHETIYLGLGVRDEGGQSGHRIGLVAFAAANIAAFRLPQNYRPCKEHFKLEHTPWAEQFRAKMQLRQRQSHMEAANNAAAARRNAAAQSLKQAAMPPAPPMPPAPAAAAAQARPAAAPPAAAFHSYGQAEDWALQAAIERELMEQNFARADFAGQGWHGFAGQQDSGRQARPNRAGWS